MAASALIAAPMIAVFFLGWRAFGLPFVPFDLFDALSRLLPGPVITHAIERMVAVIQALHLGATATIAKSAEQAMAVALFFVLFVVIAAVFLVIPKRTEGRSGIPSGLVLGILVAFLLAPPIAGGRTARVNPGIGIPWSLFILMIWGSVMGWLRGRDGASAPPGRRDVRVDAINRRQILIRLGEASAVMTIAGAVVGALPKGGRASPETGAARKSRWSETHPLPNADAPVRPAPGTRPEFTPLELHYRIDINTVPPAVTPAG